MAQLPDGFLIQGTALLNEAGVCRTSVLCEEMPFLAVLCRQLDGQQCMEGPRGLHTASLCALFSLFGVQSLQGEAGR